MLIKRKALGNKTLAMLQSPRITSSLNKDGEVPGPKSIVTEPVTGQAIRTH